MVVGGGGEKVVEGMKVVGVIEEKVGCVELVGYV